MENTDWKHPKLQKRVLGDPEKYPYPQMRPDPSKWIAPYLRSFKVIESEAATMQLDLFTEDDIKAGEYQCDHGVFYIHSTVESFEKAVDSLIKDSLFIALDIETDGLDPNVNNIRVIQLTGDGMSSHILLTEKVGDACRPAVKRVLEEAPLVFQNGVFDLGFLLTHVGVFPKKVCFDTLIAAQNVDAGFYEAKDAAFNLGALAKRYLYMTLDKSQQKTFGKSFDKPLTIDQLRYAAADTIATWRLAVILAEEVRKKAVERTIRELDLPCMAPAVHIRVAGCPIDIEQVYLLGKEMQPKIKALEEELYAELGFSVEDLDHEEIFELVENKTGKTTTRKVNSKKDTKSTQKLIEAFHAMGHTGLTSTSESAIGSYFLGKDVRAVKPDQKEIIKSKCKAAGLLLEYRHLIKGMDAIVKGYTEKYYNPKTNSVHPNLNICGSLSEEANGHGKDVATGRFSSSGPNFMQVPADQKYRDIFRAPKGYCIIKVDASQQEVRIMADVSGDENMQKPYLEETTKAADIYRGVAATTLGIEEHQVTSKERKLFKAVVLGVGYAAGPATVAASADIPEDDAREAINSYFSSFPKVKQFINKAATWAEKYGYLQNDYSGRRRHWNAKNLVDKEFKYRTQGANFYIQGGAADCSKKAFLMAYEQLSQYGCRPMPPVHDELVFLAPEEHANECLSILEKCMIEGSEYFMKHVPMKAEGALGHTWKKEAGDCEVCGTSAEERISKNKGNQSLSLVSMEKIDNEYKVCCLECLLKNGIHARVS